MAKVRAYEVNGTIVKDGVAWDAALVAVEAELDDQYEGGDIKWEDIVVSVKCVWVDDQSTREN